jgi:hypothetical protein
MAEYVVKRPVKRPPIHPGELVREEVLPALGLSVSETARRLGICLYASHHPRNGSEAGEACRQRSRPVAAHAADV